MRRYIKLKHSKGLYDRDKCIYVSKKICDVCGRYIECISTDASGQEYSEVSICLNCATKAINGDI